MEGTMKALIYRDVGKVTCEELPIPDAGDDGVLVKVARAGICGSDIHAFTKGAMAGGLWGNDVQFGHEFVGTVVEAGKNVKGIAEGDRVWIHPDYCHGDPRKSCMAGGFAEYAITIDAKLGETVFRLPDAVPFETAVLLEPMGVGVHTKNRSGAKPGDKVLMYGAGPIGLMGWAAMQHQGVTDVLIAELLPERVAFAKECGASAFCNEGVNAFEKAAEVFGTANPYTYERADVDVVIDMAGVSSIMGEFLENGRGNATFSTLGIDGTPLEIHPNEFMSKEFTVVGARGYTTADILECLDVLENGDFDMAKLVTSEFTLEECMEAFETACKRAQSCKVVFDISD